MLPFKTPSTDKSEFNAAVTFQDEEGNAVTVTGQEFAALMERVNKHTTGIGQAGVLVGRGTELGDYELPQSKVDRLGIGLMPKGRRDRIKRAFQWKEDDDLICDLVDVKAKFGVMGFTLRVTQRDEVLMQQLVDAIGKTPDGKPKPATDPANPPVGADPAAPPPEPEISEEDKKLLIDQATLQAKLDDIMLHWNFYNMGYTMAQDWAISDSMILYWVVEQGATLGEDSEGSPDPRSKKDELTPGVIDICVLSAKDVDWDNSYGNDILQYDIPDLIVAKINKALQDDDAAKAKEALIKEGIRETWIKAVEDGEKSVRLSREDGDRWIVETRERAHAGLATPSMKTIFNSLHQRSMMIDGEWSAALMMKMLMLHAKTGESIESGNLAGQRMNWAKKEDIEKLYKQITTGSTALRIVTNHTVTFEYIYPDEEIFSEKKFQNSERRIYNWGGVSLPFMTGMEGTNAGGFLGVKRMVADCGDFRTRFKNVLSRFFADDEMAQIIGLGTDYRVETCFDENALKEPRQLLEEVALLLEQGIHDPQVAASELGRNPKAIAQFKVQSIQLQKSRKLFSKVGSDVPAVSSGKPGAPKPNGRPAKPGTQRGEDTRQQGSKVTS